MAAWGGENVETSRKEKADLGPANPLAQHEEGRPPPWTSTWGQGALPNGHAINSEPDQLVRESRVLKKKHHRA